MKTLPLRTISRCFVLVLFIVFSCGKNNETHLSPFQFLTPEAAIVLYAHRPDVFVSSIQKHPFYSSVKSTEIAKNLERDLELWRLLTGDSSVQYSYEKPLVAGLVLTGARQYGWIFITQLPGEPVLKIDTSLFGMTSVPYEGETLYQITSKASDDFYVATSGSICLVSRHKVLIEEALRTRQSAHSLEYVSAFKEAFKTINKKDPLNILINLREFSELTKVLLKGHKRDWISQIGQWVAMDADVSEPIIRFDGLIQVPDSQGYFLSVLAHNTPGEKKLHHLPIPQFANAFVHVNLGNYATFYRKYTQYLEQTNKLIKHQKLWENELKSFPKAAIQDQLRGEFGCFYIQHDNALKKVFYFRTANAEKTAELMQLTKRNAQPLQYRGYVIYPLDNFKLLNALFARFSDDIQEGYYTWTGEFVVMAENESVLFSCINAWEESSLLTRDKDFEKISAKSGQTGHLIAYSKKSHFQKYLIQNLEKNYTRLSQIAEQLGNQNQSLLQVSYLHQSAYVSIIHSSETSDDQSIRQLWTLRSADIAFGPVRVVNHLTQKDEILYQDTKAVVHLLSSDGTTLWKKQLDAPIVYSAQWDMYKNNRLQHVLITHRSIYVLDRNGNDVKPWPVHLKNDITAAALMDYENTKNYRLLVGEGTTLHNLDTEAKSVKGWQLTKLSAPLAYNPKHYSSRGLDYLLFQLQDGTILVTDRTGTSRLKTNAYPYKTTHAVQINFPKDDKSWFVTFTKTNGEQINAFQNGKVDSVKILQGADFGHLRHEGDFLGYAFGNKVVVRDQKTFFDSKVPFKPTTAPDRLEVDSRVLYAIASSSDEKVALLGSDGKIIEGFPVYGSAPPIVLRADSDDYIILLTQSNQGHLLAYGVSKKLITMP
ncbi:MAG: DUF3352 domain-containing protein [Thermaurantimonas sp.]